MAELHDLSPIPGSRKDRKRIGRGPGSGTGKTSGRGQKGQKARSGGNIPAGFEGGQMPLHRRIPKRGFTNMSRTEYQVVNVRDMNGLEGEVTPQVLKERGLVGSKRHPIKILGEGEMEVALHVSAHAFSKSARSKIEGAGGSVTELDEHGAPGQPAEGAGAESPAGAADEAATAETSAADQDSGSSEDEA